MSHISIQFALYNSKRSLLVIVGWYLEGLRGAQRIRENVNRLNTMSELETLLHGVLE